MSGRGRLELLFSAEEADPLSCFGDNSCQDLFTLGETTTSGTCRQVSFLLPLSFSLATMDQQADPQAAQGEGLYVTSATSNYGICQCASSATAAGPGAKLCPRPKANGSEAFCRRM